MLWLESIFCFLASFLSHPPIFWGKCTFHTFLIDVLTVAWEMDCGLVAMETLR